VVPSVLSADAVDMFEKGIGAGVRSSRFGTWSLITFLLLVLAPVAGGPALVWWLPLLVCAGATLAALGWGLVGLFVHGQRQAAFYGLLKAALPTLAAGALVFLIVALSSMSFE
jgi:hypothetical protein